MKLAKFMRYNKECRLALALALIILVLPAIAQTAGKQQPVSRMSQAEKTAKMNSYLESWQRDYGFDPNTATMMREKYLNPPSSSPRPSQSVIDFAKQLKYGQSTKSNSPPSDFPVPVFKGSNTQYIIRPSTRYADSRVQANVTGLSITTADSARTVVSWYKSSLEQAGWKVLDSSAMADQIARDPQALARIPGGYAPNLKRLSTLPSQSGVSSIESLAAQKRDMQCSIQLIEYRQPHRTEVTISVSRP